MPIRNCIFAILLVSLVTSNTFGQGAARRSSSYKASKPNVITIGIFVQDIYDIDIRSGQYSALFYVWFRSKTKYDPSGFQIVNGTVLEKLPADSFDISKGLRYYSFPMRARLSAKLNFARFPFESIELPIVVEDDSEDNSIVRYISDKTDSGLSKDVSIPGYIQPKGNFEVFDYLYPTGFGELTGSSGEKFSRAVFTVQAGKMIERMLLKFFIPGVLALLVGYLTLYVKPQDLDARFGLVIAAVFFQITGFSILADQLPPHAGLTLGEKLLFWNWIALFVLIIVSVVSLRQYHTDSKDDDRKCDIFWRWMFPVFVSTGYVLVLVF